MRDRNDTELSEQFVKTVIKEYIELGLDAGLFVKVGNVRTFFRNTKNNTLEVSALGEEEANKIKAEYMKIKSKGKTEKATHKESKDADLDFGTIIEEHRRQKDEEKRKQELDEALEYFTNMEEEKRKKELDKALAYFSGSDKSTREGINYVKQREARTRQKSRNMTRKRNIKNKSNKNKNIRFRISEETKEKIKEIAKKVLKVAAIGTVTIGMIFAIHQAVKEEQAKVENTTTRIVVTAQQDEEEKIDTVHEVEEDFINLYLQAYNEKYGTNYRSAELKTTDLREGVVYKMEDGRVITRGSLPYETEKVLGKYGNFKMVDGYDTVVQVISEAGIPLGTYNWLTGEFLYSGNYLEDFEDPNFREPSLEELGIDRSVMSTAASVHKAEGIESKDSIRMRIRNYNSAKEEAGQAKESGTTNKVQSTGTEAER